jgi:hypothetical protein
VCGKWEGGTERQKVRFAERLELSSAHKDAQSGIARVGGFGPKMFRSSFNILFHLSQLE